MSFFDDEGDEPPTAIRTSRPTPRHPANGRRRGPDDRTLLFRRAGAALIAVLVVVLIVLGVKTLLDRQATDALKAYVTNVDNVVASEQSQVVPFFTALDLAYNSSAQNAVANNIQQEVQAVAADYATAQSWSVPSQMVAGQRAFVSVLGFRRQALAAIEAAIPTALGTLHQATAITQIAGAMEMLLTADVIYAERAAPLIEQALTNAGLSGQTVSPSTFLPDVGWLTPAIAAERILGYVPVQLGGQALQPGVSNGHELLGVTYGSNTVLSTTSPNSIVLGTAGVTFTLQVKNSGTGTVHDVITQVSFFARGVNTSCLFHQSSIQVTRPAQTYYSPIVVVPEATCGNIYGVPLRMTAEVVPVFGETDKHNNYIHALVTFQH